jgi:spermidine synthase
MATRLWFDEEYAAGHGDSTEGEPVTRLGISVEKTLFRGKSEYQEVMVFESKGWGRVLTLDGCFMVTERDEYVYHEMLAHPAMSAHGSAKNVLIIGGGDGGTVREVLKHDPDHVDLVEIDKMVIDASREFLPSVAGKLSDPRVSINTVDGLQWVKDRKNTYDVILVDSCDPVGPGIGLFRAPFYKDCAASLKKGGIFVNQSESPHQHPDIIKEIYSELRKAYKHQGMYLAHMPTYPTGCWSFAFNSNDLTVQEGIARAAKGTKPIETKYYNRELHAAAFVLPNAFRKQVEV